MHRPTVRALSVVSLVGLLAAAALPAHAKGPKLHRGKKPLGEITSFDAASGALVVDLPGEEDFSGTIDPDVQVKLDHRGWAKRSESKGNPTRGSIEDLIAGTPVLRLKVEDDLVTKIRIRPLAEEAPEAPAEDGDQDEDSGDEDAAPDDGSSDEGSSDEGSSDEADSSDEDSGDEDSTDEASGDA